MQRDEFWEGLLECGIETPPHVLSEAEFDRVFSVLDPHGDGVLLKERWTKFMNGRDGIVRARVRSHLLAWVAVDQGALSFHGAKEMFRKLDADGDGKLEREELVDGLRAHGLLLDDDEISSMWSCIDIDESGSISLYEWQDFMGFSHARTAKEKVHLATKSMVLAVRSRNKDCTDIEVANILFEQLNNITVDEFIDKEEYKVSVCTSHDLMMTESSFEAMWEIIDPEGEGRCSRECWVQFLIGQMNRMVEYSDVVHGRDLLRAALLKRAGGADSAMGSTCTPEALLRLCKNLYATTAEACAEVDKPINADRLIASLARGGIELTAVNSDWLRDNLPLTVEEDLLGLPSFGGPETASEPVVSCANWCDLILRRRVCCETKLKKLGGKLKNKWQDRHFTLTDARLTWSKVKGSAPPTGAEVKGDDDGGAKGGKGGKGKTGSKGAGGGGGGGDDDDPDDDEQNSVLIQHISFVKCQKEGSQPFCLLLTTPAKTYVLAAPDRPTQTQWNNALAKAMGEKDVCRAVTRRVEACLLGVQQVEHAHVLALEFFDEADVDNHAMLSRQELHQGLQDLGTVCSRPAVHARRNRVRSVVTPSTLRPVPTAPSTYTIDRLRIS